MPRIANPTKVLLLCTVATTAGVSLVKPSQSFSAEVQTVRNKAKHPSAHSDDTLYAPAPKPDAGKDAGSAEKHLEQDTARPGGEVYPLEGPGARLGLDWGLGKASNDAGTIDSRTVNTFTLSGMAGYKISGFMPAVVLDLRFTGQNTDPAEVKNSNVKGTEYLIGLGSTYTYDRFIFLAILDLPLIGQYKLSKQAGSMDLSYKKPLGYKIGVGYAMNETLGIEDRYPISLDLSFQSVSYSHQDLGGTDTDISANKFKHWNFGLGASIRY